MTTTSRLISSIANSVALKGGLEHATPVEIVDALTMVLFTYISMQDGPVRSPLSAVVLERIAENLHDKQPAHA